MATLVTTRFPVIHIDPATATDDELKLATRMLEAARRVACCREHGHSIGDLTVTFALNDALMPVGGPPTGVACTNCGTTWPIGPAQPADVSDEALADAFTPASRGHLADPPAPRNPYPG